MVGPVERHTRARGFSEQRRRGGLRELELLTLDGGDAAVALDLDGLDSEARVLRSQALVYLEASELGGPVFELLHLAAAELDHPGRESGALGLGEHFLNELTHGCGLLVRCCGRCSGERTPGAVMALASLAASTGFEPAPRRLTAGRSTELSYEAAQSLFS
jgi:hypothetical protein